MSQSAYVLIFLASSHILVGLLGHWLGWRACRQRVLLLLLDHSTRTTISRIARRLRKL